MCRFLMVKSKKPVVPRELLLDFARMCEKSRALDGDRQGDGWGIACWLGDWEVYKSLEPIWEEEKKFGSFLKTRMFVVHARSAFKPEQKGVIDYNQPFIKDDYCFVFNGTLRKVNLHRWVEGEIGAQKIFSLLQEYLKSFNPGDSLRKLERLLVGSSELIEGLDIGLVFKDRFFALCQYLPKYADYFSLRYYKSDDLTVIASSEVGGFSFQSMESREIVVG